MHLSDGLTPSRLRLLSKNENLYLGFVLIGLSLKSQFIMDPDILRVTKVNLNSFERNVDSIESKKVQQRKPPIVDFPVRLNLTGNCINSWKTNNILGEYEFTDLDETNRPMFKRLARTRDGEEVFLFYFEWEKCWQVGGSPDDPDAEESCWFMPEIKQCIH